MVILIKDSKAIAYIKKNQNLCIFKFIVLEKTMAVINGNEIVTKKQVWLIHLVNQNKCIKIWH